MIVVGIYIKDSVTLEYNRVELFDDEKISVNSSIQNVNDISKTYTDFSQTFTVPASKQNNKIFRHWYENSNDNGFSTLVKADAYIEIDTIPFRSGKIQLESANVKDGQPQDYSITFIGALGSLKDKFNGLYLKDLTDNYFDFSYNASNVLSKITTATSSDVMFPLISSNRYWVYGGSGVNDINSATYPIRYNELFPAIKLVSILSMIENQFGINFSPTPLEPNSFKFNEKFTSAYLLLKNAENFNIITQENVIEFFGDNNYPQYFYINTLNFEDSFGFINTSPQLIYNATIKISVSIANLTYNLLLYKNGVQIKKITHTQGASNFKIHILLENIINVNPNDIYSVKIQANAVFTINIAELNLKVQDDTNIYTNSFSLPFQLVDGTKLSIKSYFPEIKIEDFFSGILKMFNLVCYSKNGINYTIRQLEEYYENGNITDITKYIKSDNINLNKVKTYKKINFEYEKSESLVNVGFMSANGIEYGSLFYDTGNDGDEYNIKLPFEDLNFNNLQDKLQVGYALKTDLQKYIPKPVILYDYNPTDTTDLSVGVDFKFSTALTGILSNTTVTSYKAFGQEYFNGTDTYSLNFNAQQSTLTNELISNSLYQQYYENYLDNIFDSKARLIKVSGILPTSLLTTLKLNDRLIIRDKRYLINTFTTDLTTGEVQFELLTDNRIL